MYFFNISPESDLSWIKFITLLAMILVTLKFDLAIPQTHSRIIKNIVIVLKFILTSLFHI
jgi:hypothetical protein